jgi:hypothetical protein
MRRFLLLVAGVMLFPIHAAAQYNGPAVEACRAFALNAL